MEVSTSCQSFKVCGLNSSINETELLEVFVRYEIVTKFQLLKNGVVNVQYYNTKDAQTVFKKLSKDLIFGRLIWIIDNVRYPVQKFLIKNLRNNVNSEQLLAMLAPYGQILCCVVDLDEQGFSLGTAQVHFSNCDIPDILKKLNGLEVTHHKLNVSYLGPPTKKILQIGTAANKILTLVPAKEPILGSYLLVSNLSMNVTDVTIRREFELFGSVADVKVVLQGDKRCAYIFYNNPDELNTAVVLMAEGLAVTKTARVRLIKQMASPPLFGHLCLSPIVAHEVNAPQLGLSWNLKWQVYVIPTYDSYEKWDVYQFFFQEV